MSPELRVLLAMLRASMSGQPDPEGITRLDWSLLLALAARHRVIPALAEGLGHAEIQVPPSIQEALDEANTQAVLDELALAASLGEICRRATEAKLPITVLKGVPLSFTLHGRLGQRISRDIDLLVSPDHGWQVLRLLVDLGFRPIGGNAMPDRNTFAQLMQRKKDIELFHPGRRQLVELHWRLFDNPRLLTLDPKLPVESVSLPMGLDLLVLKPDFNLLYLANHGCQHGWSRLKWLADFAAFAARFDSDALTVLYRKTPVNYGRRAFAQALLLSQDLFGLQLSPDLAASLRRGWRVRVLVASALHCLTSSGPAELEALHFGSTIKNLSHYLLSGSPAYILAELRQDFADMSAEHPGTSTHRPCFTRRLVTWLKRHCGPRVGRKG